MLQQWGVTASQLDASADTVHVGSTDVVSNGENNVVGAQNSLNKAKATEQNAQSDVDKASSNVEKATVTEKTAQANLQKATEKLNDAQLVKSKATTEAISNAKNSVEQTQSQFDKVNDQLDKLTGQLSSQNEIVVNNQNAVKEAKQANDSAQTKLNVAGVNQSNAQKTVNESNSAVEQDNANIANGRTIVSDTQANINVTSNDLKQAQVSLAPAQEDLNNKSAALDNAKKALKAAQTRDNNAQSKLDEVNSKIQNYNTIKISNVAEFEQAFKDYFTDAGLTNSDKANLLKLARENTYKTNKADAGIKVDPNNLTPDQKLELTLFGADLLNQIRDQLGIPRVIVTKGAMKFANDVKAAYLADGWNKMDHDEQGISRAAGENGLTTGGNYYEDAGFFSEYSYEWDSVTGFKVNETPVTMDHLKSHIYDSLVMMLFGTTTGDFFEMLHTQGILGTKFMTGDTKSGKAQYFSLIPSTFKDAQNGSPVTMIHLLNISYQEQDFYPSMLKDPSKFDVTEIAIPTLNDLKQQLPSLEQSVSEAKKELSNATEKNAQAQSSYDVSKANVNKVQKTINDLQGKLSQLNSKLTQAKSDLANSQRQLVQDQKNAEEALNDLDQANIVLRVAKERAAETQSSLDNANLTLDKDKADLNDLTNQKNAVSANLSNIQKKLEKANDDYQLLLNAGTNLEKAKKDYDAALDADNLTKKDLLKAQSDFKTKQAILSSARVSVKNAQDKLRQAQETANKSAHQAAVDRAKQEVAQAEKDYRQHADAFAKQQQVVNEKRAALESVKKEIAATPMWSASQAQQLAAFVAQYGKQNDLKFYQYDGKTSFNLGDNYPNFNSLHVKGNSSATIGMSTNGAGNYDYNVVAVFNHTPTNSKQFIEWHDTYFFAFHNGQPVVLVDYSTNGKPALVDVSQVTSKYSGRLNAFQNEFAALVGKVQNANKEKLQQAQADFDNANSKLAELTTGKDNAAQALQDAQAELAAVNGDRTAGSHRMADVVNGKTNVMTLQGHGASASVSLADSKQATGTSGQSSLPQTGNKESAAALALGAVSAMFGLGLMKKREY